MWPLLKWIGRWLPARRDDSRASQSVLICIDEELLGMPFGWGPEIDELADRLSRLAAEERLGEFDGAERTASGCQLLFHTPDAARFIDEAAAILRASPMHPITIVRVSDSHLGAWRDMTY